MHSLSDMKICRSSSEIHEIQQEEKSEIECQFYLYVVLSKEMLLTKLYLYKPMEIIKLYIFNDAIHLSF